MDLYDELLKSKPDVFEDRYELTTGVVKSNYDEKFKGKVQVMLDYFDKTANESEWLPVASSYAGKGYGSYFLPEVNDQVLIAYINGDPHTGIVIASLWNPANTHPDNTVNDKNNIKKIITKAGHQIFFDDEDKKGGITVKTKKELQILIQDENEIITIKDKDNKNLITIDSKNGKIEVKADKEIHINGGNKVPVKIDGSDITINGKNIKLNAQSGIDIKGQQIQIDGQSIKAKGSDVGVESSGMLKLKGSITQINC